MSLHHVINHEKNKKKKVLGIMRNNEEWETVVTGNPSKLQSKAWYLEGLQLLGARLSKIHNVLSQR